MIEFNSCCIFLNFFTLSLSISRAGETVGEGLEHAHHGDGRAGDLMVARGDNAGDAVDRLAVVGAGRDEIRRDGAEDHHDHKHQVGVEVSDLLFHSKKASSNMKDISAAPP